MTTRMQYERLGGVAENFETHINRDMPNVDCEETPHESGVMIHVVESNRTRWNHIEDLDSFFSRMYRYHQKHGFTCMMLQEVLELSQFIFVVFFSTFLFHCVDYPVLFKDRIDNTTLVDPNHKTSLGDAIIPAEVCVSNFGALTWVCLLCAFLVWALRSIKVLYHLFQFWDIKLFYNTALKIDDSELDNLTWHEVQNRVRCVQREQQMCIHKRDLSELDIYHRILRFQNYLVAMVNKNLLPVHLHVPFFGFDLVFMTRGLKYNLEMLLFWGPWSPFENNWHLREDYKKSSMRHELAARLARQALWLGLANLVLCPLVTLWQLLHSFFNYAEAARREPGTLGSRCWSTYGRIYLRHFNELDHELHARLTRAYRPASKYMNSFTSPLMAVLAKNIGFLAASILAVLIILTVYDEDVLTIEHVLTLMTVLGGVVASCRVFIPDENLVRCPEALLTAVLAHVHYLPDSWRGHAHTSATRYEFSQLFQYRAVNLIEELLSPVVTPYILCVKVRARALDIVDFYRNFTVAVIGVGDVCSFAQMDVRKHGHPDWQMGSGGNIGDIPVPKSELVVANQYTQAEAGKTELSLIHFTLTNPTWKMPSDAQNFVQALKRNAQKDLYNSNIDSVNPMYQSLHSVSSLGVGYQSLMQSLLNNVMLHQSSTDEHLLGVNTSVIPATNSQLNPILNVGNVSQRMDNTTIVSNSVLNQNTVMRGGLCRAEGPIFNDQGLLHSLHQNLSNQPSMGASIFGVHASNYLGNTDVNGTVNMETTAADMSLSTLYLHELHHRQIQRRGVRHDATQRSLWQRPHRQTDTTTANIGITRQSSHTDGATLEPLAENTPLLHKR